MSDLERLACTPEPLRPEGFNDQARIPYGCTVAHIRQAMTDFPEFLGFVDEQMHTRSTPRLESFLMPASFSSMVGEFMAAAIPRYRAGLARNQYHNGHPDLVPAGRFEGDAVQYAKVGIEVKASRYPKGWQGHDPEDCWLLVFVFDANGPKDGRKGIQPRPFRFLKVVGARLRKSDWQFAGRSDTSRRTITATVLDSGYRKMTRNRIYVHPIEGCRSSPEE
jgi:hypothetical protein